MADSSWGMRITSETSRALPGGMQALAKGLRDSGDRYLAVEARKATGEVGAGVRLRAAAFLEAAPGRYSKSRTRIEARERTVALVAPWAPGAEWGSNNHHVFGRKTADRWGIWPLRVKPGIETGYVLGAAWRVYKSNARVRMRMAGRDAIRTGMAANGIRRVA